MAESFDKRERSPAISDDLIKEALKTGLSSIQPSDELLKKTIENCRKEVMGANEGSKSRKLFLNPVFYRLGAPLAIGVLALVLIFSRNQLFYKNATSDSAPEAAAPSAEMAQKEKDTGEESKLAGFAAARAPSEASSADSASGGAGEMEINNFSDGQLKSTRGSLRILNSLTPSSETWQEESAGAYMPEFIGIADQYNDMNGTDLTLDQEGIIRVHTLVETGINANSLLNAQSYQEILSGKGYWVLPLRDSQGTAETLLNVNAINADDEELDVSGSNFEYGSEGREYLAAIQPSGDVTARENEILFDLENLKNLVLVAGYKTISEIVIADINDGMDFLVFVKADGVELAVPCFTDSGLFGLENNKVYAREDLFEIIGNNMLH